MFIKLGTPHNLPRNLLVAGRCVSSDRGANSALRVEASCMAMGQVAGEVAALAALSRRTPLDVPLGEVRKGLAASGAIVPDVPEGETMPRRSRP